MRSSSLRTPYGTIVYSLPEKLSGWPCVRWPPCDRFMPRTVSPGLSSVKYTAMLACAPRVFLCLRDLVDPALMPSAVERRREPEREDLVGQAEGDDPAAHGEHVGVVVLAREARRIQVVAERGADAAHLVGRYLLA